MICRLGSLLLLLLPLIACTPLQDAGVQRFQATGIEGAFSAQRVVSDHPVYTLIGRVFVLRQDGTTTYSIEVGQVRVTGQQRLRMDAAWHDGRRVVFRPTRRRERYCIGNSDCSAFATGLFPLTAAQFGDAAARGFRATLLGPDGRVAVDVPPDMFLEAQALAEARLDGNKVRPRD